TRRGHRTGGAHLGSRLHCWTDDWPRRALARGSRGEVTHVNASANAGTFQDDDPWRVKVADHPTFFGELHTFGSGDVPYHHAAHDRVANLDVGLHHARRLDDQRPR